jgi:hypothetical protein
MTAAQRGSGAERHRDIHQSGRHATAAAVARTAESASSHQDGLARVRAAPLFREPGTPNASPPAIQNWAWRRALRDIDQHRFDKAADACRRRLRPTTRRTRVVGQTPGGRCPRGPNPVRHPAAATSREVLDPGADLLKGRCIRCTGEAATMLEPGGTSQDWLRHQRQRLRVEDRYGCRPPVDATEP